jgi:uncharacterized protein YegL
MRRLPIFLVIDVSESMVGEPLQQVGAGIRSMVQTLRRDPYALETAYLSVVVFAGRVKTLVPLTDMASFYPPQLPLGGGTSLGAALTHLMSEIETKIVKTSAESKGDWKPIVFLFTDGAPTDDPEDAVAEWAAKYRTRANLVAVSVGNNADLALLAQLTDQVLLLNDAHPESYQRFFNWITASIQTQSQRLDASADDRFRVENLSADLVRKVSPDMRPRQRLDENFVVLTARCGKTRMAYLIKYARERNAAGGGAPAGEEWPEFIGEETPAAAAAGEQPYVLAGAFAVPSPEEYEELTAANYGATTISTGELRGTPSCPCCGNPFGFAMCACGNVHCLKGPGESVCPWCGKTGSYDFGTGDADVTRALG